MNKLLLGITLGLLAGVVAAVAIPRHHDTAGANATATPAGRPAAPHDQVLHAGRPESATQGSATLRPVGSAQTEATAHDPHGGPDWAVRVYRGERVLTARFARPGADRVIAHLKCAQLGRIHAGRFGWLDARGTFRATPPQWGTSSVVCATPKAPAPLIGTLSPITDPDASAARVRSTIVWGMAGPAARTVRIKVSNISATTQRATPHHAFLMALPARYGQRDVHVGVVYNNGRTASGPPNAARFALVARAPDPNGGLPYGLETVPSIVPGAAARGETCLFGGGVRVVGDRAGAVDYRRDVLDELEVGGGGGCGSDAQMAAALKKMTCLPGISSGTGDTAGEGGDTGGGGRVARRTQHSLTTITMRCATDVDRVTLQTPRDVRTLVLSGTGAIAAALAVYDGQFSTGGIRWTAHFRDGHTKNGTVPDVGF
jgi:hypothetical protein